eukprot:COSAG06_NODE_383_length_16525_cov_86.720017_9_plen_321_part_00
MRKGDAFFAGAAGEDHRADRWLAGVYEGKVPAPANISVKRLKIRLSGSARKSQKRFRDTPRFKFQAVLFRSVEKRGDQSRFKSLGLYTNIRRSRYGELDESVGTLLEIMSDLEKGNEESPMASAIMQQVTVKIKEVLDQVTREQKAAAAQSAKEMEQAKLEADAALKAESERLRKETAERKAAEKERAQQSQLAIMKAKAAAEKTRAKCLVEGWVALESVTVVGEKKRDAKRKQSWIELTPGLLSLHKQFLGHASSCLPVLAADVRVVERQEKKPGSGVFSNEKIPVCEKRRFLLSTCCTENDHFTKTGSGQLNTGKEST